MTPPPPLVAAPAVPPPDASRGSWTRGILFGASVTAGLANWSSSGGTFNGTTLGSGNETDFGLLASLDGGYRLTHNLGLELFLEGGWSPLLAGRTGLLGGIGLGLRFDHLGPLPGHFTLAGAYTAGSITADSAADIDFSGGSVLLQYTMPVFGYLGVQGQAAVHFLNYGLTLFTLSAGIAFGN